MSFSFASPTAVPPAKSIFAELANTIQVTNVTQQDDSLTATLNLPTPISDKLAKYSAPKCSLKDMTLDMRVEISNSLKSKTVSFSSPSADKPNFTYSFFIMTETLPSSDMDGITCEFSSVSLGIKNRELPTSTKKFYLLIHTSNEKPFGSPGDKFAFDVEFKLIKRPQDPTDMSKMFSSLYDDMDLIDFELQVEEGKGSVKMHKCVLAAASPVLKAECISAWQNTDLGSIQVEGISKSALENFKKYLYLRKIPENGCEELLLIANTYEMPDLKKKCIQQLTKTVSAENFIERCEFAIEHKIKTLFKALLKPIEERAFNVDDIVME